MGGTTKAPPWLIEGATIDNGEPLFTIEGAYPLPVAYVVAALDPSRAEATGWAAEARQLCRGPHTDTAWLTTRYAGTLSECTEWALRQCGINPGIKVK